MLFVGVVPDIMAQAAGELESLGSTLSAANAAAAAPTTGVVALGLDNGLRPRWWTLNWRPPPAYIEGKPETEIAREVGVNRATVRRWLGKL